MIGSYYCDEPNVNRDNYLKALNDQSFPMPREFPQNMILQQDGVPLPYPHAVTELLDAEVPNS